MNPATATASSSAMPSLNAGTRLQHRDAVVLARNTPSSRNGKLTAASISTNAESARLTTVGEGRGPCQWPSPAATAFTMGAHILGQHRRTVQRIAMRTSHKLRQRGQIAWQHDILRVQSVRSERLGMHSPKKSKLLRQIWVLTPRLTIQRQVARQREINDRLRVRNVIAFRTPGCHQTAMVER